MWVGLILILCSVAIIVVSMRVVGNDPRTSVIWGAGHFVVALVLTLISMLLLEPNLFPDWLRETGGYFGHKLTPSRYILSFLLSKLFAYGPMGLVTAVSAFLIVTAGLGKPRANADRPSINWKERLG